MQFPEAYETFSSFQLGPRKTVPLSIIEEKWADLSLPKEQFDELVRVGTFSGEVEWLKFFALGCSALGEVGCASWASKVYLLAFICWTIS